MQFNLPFGLIVAACVSITTAQSSTPTSGDLTGPCATIQSQLVAKGSFAAVLDPGATWACMNSIPINSADATSMVKYGQTYLGFISTLGWLKDPPPSYIRPSIDVLSELDSIAAQINSTGSDALQSQLELDLLVRNVTVRTRDGHNTLRGGILKSFSFSINFTVVALSQNGSDTPQIYVYEDVVKAGAGPGGQNQGFTPVAIKSLGGKDPIDFLRNFTNANQPFGYLEEHAEFNAQMQSYVGLVGGSMSNFNQSNIYNGDSLSVVYQDGTSFTANYTAKTGCDFRTASSVQDIYDMCVLSVTTAGTAPSAVPSDPPDETDGSSNSPEGIRSSQRGPFPDPIVVQDGLGSTGFVTGYTLNDTSLAVLSIPSFEATDFSNATAVQTFSKAIADFIDRSTQAEKKNVVIDLTANGGGSIFLGYDTFKQFFPDVTPYIGYNVPSTPNWNSVGTAWTTVTANGDGNLTGKLAATYVPFDANMDLDNQGNPYHSWSQVEGPVTDRSAQLTNSIQHDFNNSQIWSGLSSGQFQYVYGYGDRANASAVRPWSVDNIVMLTDGQCGSTCAIFQELMKTQGVRSIVMGGLPSTTGPMQAVGGTRGSNDETIPFFAQALTELHNPNLGLSSDIVSSLPSDVPTPRITFNSASFNARNMVRNNSDVALQFTYQAADCRLWYTIPMVTDYTVLWKQVADVAFNGNTGLCVQGSTGHPTAKANVTSTDAPDASGSGGSGGGSPSGTGSAPSASSTQKSMGVVGAGVKGMFVAFVVGMSCAFVLS